jgi:HSP20 family protein
VAAARAFQQTTWQPAVDVYKTAGGWLLKYELAGVSPQDVELAVCGSTITVRGVRRDVSVDERQQSYSMEISYNQFERSLQMPCELDAMHVSLDYRDGMLIVRLSCEDSGT